LLEDDDEPELEGTEDLVEDFILSDEDMEE